jgi:hypothetical protein
VGFSRKRTGNGGRVRYTAIYRDLRGRQRSAGSFATRREADRAWQRAEVMLGLGRVGDPARGRQTFERYVEDTWFPNHQVEVTTRQVYWYCLRKHILPEFGPMKMVEILPEHVREWVTKMKDRGLSPAMIAGNKVILSGIFTTALNDQITFLHPCKGVKTPTVPVKPYTIITPEQFSAVYEALPDPMWRLLVETDIESGLRWGELTELRVRDIEFGSRMLTVSRTVVQVSPKFHPAGDRFLVKDYPKDGEFRRFKLSAQIVAKLQAHVVEHDLGRNDLLFWAPEPDGPKVRKLRLVVDPEALGLTEPNAGTAVPARHDDRILAGPMPVRLLQGHLRPVPGRPESGRQGRSTSGADTRHRRAHPGPVVPADCMAARAEGGEPRDSCPPTRFAACARLGVVSERSCVCCIVRRFV